MNTCATCLYHNNGECHRYPPTVVAYTETDNKSEPGIEAYTRSEFPSVLPTKWCGEWKESYEGVPL